MDFLFFVLDVPEWLSRNAVRLILVVMGGLALIAAGGMAWQILGPAGGG